MIKRSKNLPLTNPEKKIWGFLLGYLSDNGYMPTRREIANAMGYGVKVGAQTIQYFLRNMEKKGFIKLGRNWRDIKLTNG